MEAHIKIAAAQGLEAAHEFAHALEGKLEQLAGRFTRQELNAIRDKATELRTEIANLVALIRSEITNNVPGEQPEQPEQVEEPVQHEPSDETKEPIGETEDEEGQQNNG